MYSQSNIEARAQPDHLGDKASFMSTTDEKAFDASPVTYAVFCYQEFYHVRKVW